jgi:hypothetical protein
MPRGARDKHYGLRDSAERPAKPAWSTDEALSEVDRDPLMKGKQEGGDSSRTRPPMQNHGTWGDTVFPGCHHTSDPAAPKVTKSY